MTDQGAAHLTAATKLTAPGTIVPGLTSLWYAYLTAADNHAQLQSNWHYVRQAALSDGTAGLLYAQLYTAEQAKDHAYTAWANFREAPPPPVPVPPAYVLPGTVGYLGAQSGLTPYAPAGSGFPGAGNAPPGWTWESYGLRNDTSPETLDHVQIYGGVYTAGNVITINQSKIYAGTGGEIAPVAHHGAAATAGGKITCWDSTLTWLPGTQPPTGDDVAPIFDTQGPLYDIRRCDLSGTPQGLNPPGSNIAGTPSLVLNNWIHGLVQNNPSGPNHMDGIFCEGGNYVLIQGNYIDAPSRTDVTACLFFQDVSGTDTGYIINDNYLSGGGHTFYNETVTSMIVTNNIFAGNAYFSDTLNIAPGTIGSWSGNYRLDGSLVLSP